MSSVYWCSSAVPLLAIGAIPSLTIARPARRDRAPTAATTSNDSNVAHDIIHSAMRKFL